MKPPENKKEKGFTLIELLVVVAIIAVLIAILLPAINSAREKAKETVCASNVRQIALATLSYAQNNGERIPPITGWTQGHDDGNWGEPYSPNSCSRLADQKYISPEVLYSPFDLSRKYPNNWIRDGGRNRFWSYISREPLSRHGAAILGMEYELDRPNIENFNYWFYCYPLDRLGHRAMIADRFCMAYFWSYHGGDEKYGSVPTRNNGKGWHVGFGDGSVNWVTNDTGDPNLDPMQHGQFPERDIAWVSFDRYYP